jgi:DNA-binding response OmpR family regulator
MHILLVEDDDSIAGPLAAGLSRDGFDVTRVATATDAMSAPSADLVLLDLGLPDGDGMDVCRELRTRSEVPIIVLSARAAEVDRVVLLELGADDYVVKPFGFRELVARIRAVNRRAAARDEERDEPSPTTRVGDLEVDVPARRATVAGTELALTPKEFDLLAFLAADTTVVHRRETILEHVWDQHWYGPTKTLDVHVAALRKKLGDPAWIETVRGVGFRFDAPR